MDIVLIWLLLALLFIVIGHLHRARQRRTASDVLSPRSLISAEMLADFQQRLLPVLAVAGYQVRDGSVTFEGNLRTDTQTARGEINRAFAGEKFTPLLQEGDRHGRVKIALLRGIEELAWPPTVAERPNWALHSVLVILTLVTTTWAGALQAGVNLLQEPQQIRHRFALQRRSDVDSRRARAWTLFHREAPPHPCHAAVFYSCAFRARYFRCVYQTQIVGA